MYNIVRLFEMRNVIMVNYVTMPYLMNVMQSFINLLVHYLSTFKPTENN